MALTTAWSDSADTPLELRELLREQVQRLGPVVESVLMAAAVIGREFRFTVLRGVTDLPDGELLDALDTALTGHLLEETEDGYHFHHPLIRHTLYNAPQSGAPGRGCIRVRLKRLKPLTQLDLRVSSRTLRCWLFTTTSVTNATGPCRICCRQARKATDIYAPRSSH